MILKAFNYMKAKLKKKLYSTSYAAVVAVRAVISRWQCCTSVDWLLVIWAEVSTALSYSHCSTPSRFITPSYCIILSVISFSSQSLQFISFTLDSRHSDAA